MAKIIVPESEDHSRVVMRCQEIQATLEMTLFPSVWRETGWESHFIIWNDAVLWCDNEDWDEVHDYAGIEMRVLKTLSSEVLKSIAEIADDLDEIPWEVSRACRRMARKGLVVNGPGKLSQSYKLAQRK